MTTLVPAVRMSVRRLAALVTAGDDLPADPFPQTIVKDKVLSPELVLQPLLPDGIGIIDDPPFQMIDIGKTLVKQVGAGLLATDPARTIHDDLAVLLVFQHVRRHRQLLAEGIGRYFQRILKMPDLVLV